MFKLNPLYRSDGYKPGHKAMMAPGTTKLYGTWIPRSLKHAPKGIKKILSIGHQLCWKELNDAFVEFFFSVSEEEALIFGKDMSMYLGMEYNAEHFRDLHKLGYLPIKVKALPEGIETLPNIPHQTFINTVDGFGWLTLFLETPMSNLSWKIATAGTTALQYRRVTEEYVKKTDKDNIGLIPYLCHDFSSRGLSGDYDNIAVGLGHAASFRGSDSLITIPAARYYYNEPNNEVIVNSVNASEHSVSTTKIFTVGERQMIIDWLKEIPNGIFSMVADTFSLWEFIEYLKDDEIKKLVLSRNGKLVVRPDSGDPVDIICGKKVFEHGGKLCIENNVSHFPGLETVKADLNSPEVKGVVELLWDIFGGTINEQGYKVLDPHIGAIYGDSINLERQQQIYERLAAKGFASTNIVLGIGSFTYQFVTRDTLGFAAKGAWFEIGVQKMSGISRTGYNIYKDPITDDGAKKSLKGLQAVFQDAVGEYFVKSECTEEEENTGLLQIIFEDGKFYNETTFTKIRERINSIV